MYGAEHNDDMQFKTLLAFCSLLKETLPAHPEWSLPKHGDLRAWYVRVLMERLDELDRLKAAINARAVLSAEAEAR